ncbi:hypothetical protein [Mycolicibacterium houstonense]|uniref:hypothetical protein n=1 Tax=Mycolicibacterium houstonense TaxID=146021 RepID=UPI000AAAB4E5|nr:hypothetical protein [Mycolicibacterium houstonense]
MSDAHRLIAGVIAKAWDNARDDAYLHGAYNSQPALDPDRLATDIIRAIGGLSIEGSRARCCCGHHVDLHKRSNSVNFCGAIVDGGHCPCNNFQGDDDEFGPHFHRWVSQWMANADD